MEEQRKTEVLESLRDIAVLCGNMADALESGDRKLERAALEVIVRETVLMKVLYLDLEERRGR